MLLIRQLSGRQLFRAPPLYPLSAPLHVIGSVPGDGARHAYGNKTFKPQHSSATTHAGGEGAVPAQATDGSGCTTTARPTFVLGVPATTEVADAIFLQNLPYYSAFPLDRKAELRRDSAALTSLFASPNARLMLVHNGKLLVQRQPSRAFESNNAGNSGRHPSLSTGPSAAASAASAAFWAAPLDATARPPPAFAGVYAQPATSASLLLLQNLGGPIFLGIDSQGRPYFAAAVADPAAALAAASLVGAEWQNARLAGPELSPGEAALAAVATSLVTWNGSNLYDGATGSPMEAGSGGHVRTSAAGRKVYPQVDPAVIMLVTSGDYCLLGRKKGWPEDRYSTLAGFVEVGEPLEVAVAREVQEEAGVHVPLAGVRYHASQPWPFPRSLMIGFTAAAEPRHANEPGDDEEGDVADDGVTIADGAAVATSSAAAAPRRQRRSHSAVAAADSSGNYVASLGAVSRNGHAGIGNRRGWDLLTTDGRRAAIGAGVTPAEVDSAVLPRQQIAQADQEELEDARWFHRDWLNAALHGRVAPSRGVFNIPGSYSLAHSLITSWLAAPATDAAAWHLPSVEAAQDLPQVRIDRDGSFKYVLLRVAPEEGSASGSGGAGSHLMVWGDARAGYHNDVYLHAKVAAAQHGLSVQPLGGGRITHDAAHRTVRIFGYSAAFGPAPHEVSAALVRRWYPLYNRTAVSISYDGY